ncbi:MAG: glycosyltransferase family 2 protein [Rhodobacteraceae bacterium]|nr:glycosyltransferase family 2 protein [Paracoccaceae bacterium]
MNEPALARWGLVSTIKAPAADILAFAAYHLERGAHRLYLYLDEPNPDAQPHLKAHPKIRVTDCDATYWKRHHNKRPDMHQPRQTLNASHAYRRKADVDWLIHMDVDEFLWSDRPLDAVLAELAPDALCARVRPIEALSGDGGAYKGFIRNARQRDTIVRRIYPTFGQYVKAGFLSHVAGKLFVRTGLGPLTFKIHNIYREDEENPGQVELDTVDLCHRHAGEWQDWLSHYRYRLQKGSYRPGLAPSKPRDKGGLSMHELLSAIEAEDGEAGLRAFYDELCADSPQLRERLDHEGLLRLRDLNLTHLRAKHFPEFTDIVAR